VWSDEGRPVRVEAGAKGAKGEVGVKGEEAVSCGAMDRPWCRTPAGRIPEGRIGRLLREPKKHRIA